MWGYVLYFSFSCAYTDTVEHCCHFQDAGRIFMNHGQVLKDFSQYESNRTP
jgi:hypothetical protein